MNFRIFRRVKGIAVIVLRYFSPLCSYGIALAHLRKIIRRLHRISGHVGLLDVGCGNGFVRSIPVAEEFAKEYNWDAVLKAEKYTFMKLIEKYHVRARL